MAAGVPWLFIWQGLDFSDQGYLLTGYRCFFRYPEATEDSGHMWLTNLVGATWDAAFGALGVVGMRALWALCLSVCVLLAFRLARALGQATRAAVPMLAASIFLSDRHMTTFSYDTMTSLLLAAAAVTLVRGLSSRRPLWLFASGALIGVAPFARFPNLLALALVSALGLAVLLEPERRRTLLADLGAVLLGIAAGVLAMFALITLRGDLALYLDGVRSLFEPSMEGAGYSVNTLARRFALDEAQALGVGLVICLLATGLSQLLRRLPARAAWGLSLAAGVLGACGLIQFKDSWRYAVTGTSYWLLAAIALGIGQHSAAQRLAAYVLLLVVLIAPLGSNVVLTNSHMGLWLALPLAFALLHSWGAGSLGGQGAKLALVASVVLAGEGLHHALTYTYRDSARTRLFSPIADPQLRAQWTTSARARSVSEVLAALEARVSPGDYLLAYEGTPLLQYLSQTRPYLNRPWLMGWERGDVVAGLIEQARSRIPCLPVVVVTTKGGRSPGWPDHAGPLEERKSQEGVRNVLTDFLRANDYQPTWSNGFFQIQEPSGRSSHCR